MKIIDSVELRTFLEINLKEHKEHLLQMNAKRKDDTSFLSETYDIGEPFEGKPSKHLIHVFQDLETPYPNKIFEQIKAFLEEKGLTDEYEVILAPKNRGN